MTQRCRGIIAASPRRTRGKFPGNLKLLARTTNTPQVLKTGLLAVLRGAETVLEAVGAGPGPAIKSPGGHPDTRILGENLLQHGADAVGRAFRQGRAWRR